MSNTVKKDKASKYYFKRLQERKKRYNQCYYYPYYDPFFYYVPYGTQYPYYQCGQPDITSENLCNISIDPSLYSGSFLNVQPDNVPVAPIKKQITIDTPKNIRHLVDIINHNEVRDDLEYNIDMKSLHSVKNELTELRDMIGMEKIKQSVFEQLIYFMQNLHMDSSNVNNCDYKHTVIMGPPGTGKTRVAKIIGTIYSKIGILKNNTFKKVTRNDLIAGYLGQTTIKTKKVIEDSLGGVLFIDEAYSLGNEDKEDMYAKECLDTLCEALSDYKNELMVIIAGYEDELNNRFFTSNNGLESRFIWKFKIDPYSSTELLQIFQVLVAKNGWKFLEKGVLTEKWFHDKKGVFKGLGRDMEALFTYTKVAHGLRIYGKTVDLQKKFSLEDMNSGYKTFLDNSKKIDIPSFMHTIYI